MSHEATNWALKLDGLSPTAKLVLVILADCHNPVGGCFPTQEYIARRCNIGRATVNRQLDALEGRGLLRRMAIIDEKTRKQLPTRYYLAFEDAVDKSSDNRNSVSQNETRAVSHSGRKSVSQNETQNPVIEINRNARAGARGEAVPAVDKLRWTGDPELRAEIADDPRYGQGFVHSYLDTAALRHDGAIVTATRIGWERLSGCAIVKARALRVVPP